MSRLWFAPTFVLGMMICQNLFAVPVTDGMVLWLDATDPATLFQDEDLSQPASPGDEVFGWMDKSGQNNHAVVDFLTPPTYESNVMVGKDAGGNDVMNDSVRFDGGLASGMIIDDGLFLQRPYTAFIVNQYWGDIRGRTLQARDGPNWLHGLWAGNFGSYADPAWIAQQRAQPEFIYVEDTIGDDDGGTFYANGADFGRNPAATVEPGFLAFASGGQFSGEVSDADVSEVVIYDRVLNEGELTQVRDFLYEKYGVQGLPDPTENQNLVLDGNLGTFQSATEGVDFEGEFAYALNIGGPGGAQVGDAEFTDASDLGFDSDGAEVFAINEILNWHAPNYGDFDLEEVMQSIRWSPWPESVDVNLEVVAGTSYKLQLLFAENCCDRGFDVLVEDEMVVDNLNVQLVQEGIANTEQGVVYSLNVTPTDNELNIVLVGPNEFAPDNNPILNGVTLEIGGDVGVPGDFNGNGVLDSEDIDLLGKEVVSGNNTARFDLTGDGLVDRADQDLWVGGEEFAYTWYGDSDLNGEFNSGDFVIVFTAGLYEDGIDMNAGWAEGDWNGDMEFDSSDFVNAFTDGGYEVGPKNGEAVAAVPEPSALALAMLGLMLGAFARGRRR